MDDEEEMAANESLADEIKVECLSFVNSMGCLPEGCLRVTVSVNKMSPSEEAAFVKREEDIF